MRGKRNSRNGASQAAFEAEAVPGEVVDHLSYIGGHIPGQEEAVVELGAPAHERAGIRLGPEAGDQGPDQQRLHERHAGVRRHLEAAQFEQPEPAPLRVGAEQLVDAQLGPVGAAGYVDEQVPEQAVHEPGRRGVAGGNGQALELGEGDLELVEALVAGLVDARGLAGRADEPAGEEVGERRMVLPVGDDAAEQVRPAQEGAVGWCRAAEGQVVAAAGAGVGPVEMERLCAEPGGAGVGVDAGGDVHQLRPRRGRVDVDLEHPRVRGDERA